MKVTLKTIHFPENNTAENKDRQLQALYIGIRQSKTSKTTRSKSS